jgi:uncharacterized membrane protein YkvA (DUF1232 family)
MSDSQPPIRIVPVSDVSDPWGPDLEAPTPRRSGAELLREAILVLPNLVKLMARLLRDPRVPRRRKLLMGFAGLYVMSPVDLIPEALFPVIGQVDDLLLMVFSINHLLNGVPPTVLREYWDGDPEALEVVYGVINWVADFMPPPLRSALVGD